MPARAAARRSRDQLATAADDVLIPELARLIDRAFAGTLPEEIVRSATKHGVAARVARELAASGALDRAVDDALAGPHAERVAERIVRSDAMRLAIREAMASPEVRTALARQTTGLAEELVGSVRTRAIGLDDRLDRRQPRGASPFAGIASRAAAFAIDAAVVILTFVTLSAMVALISSLIGTLRPEWLVGLLLASGLGLITASYLVVFWSGAGQTPGMRLLHLRLRDGDGGSPSVGRALVRTIGTAISIIPLFAGYLPVLWDSRRRGLPDLLAGTVVVYEGGLLELESERGQRR